MATHGRSKKRAVIARLYDRCKARGSFVFDNNEVKAACAEVDFGNPFDATKVDNSAGLPDSLLADDMFITIGASWRQRTN